jgi:transcriptional regulator GlxA family with amidase domain
MIPGGAGTRSQYINATLNFARQQYPVTPYFLTVCSGSLLASRAGVLDHKRAITNKAGWAAMVATNHKVKWIPHARWVVDGNVLSTSGVSAGTDGVLAFIECFYGKELTTTVTK